MEVQYLARELLRYNRVLLVEGCRHIDLRVHLASKQFVKCKLLQVANISILLFSYRLLVAVLIERPKVIGCRFLVEYRKPLNCRWLNFVFFEYLLIICCKNQHTLLKASWQNGLKRSSVVECLNGIFELLNIFRQKVKRAKILNGGFVKRIVKYDLFQIVVESSAARKSVVAKDAIAFYAQN